MAAPSWGLFASGAEPGTTQPANRNAASIAGALVRIRVAMGREFTFALLLARGTINKILLLINCAASFDLTRHRAKEAFWELASGEIKARRFPINRRVD